MTFDDRERQSALDLIKKTRERRISGEPVRAMSYEELFGDVTADERALIEKIYSLSPEEKRTPDTQPPLISITEQPYWIDETRYSIWNTFVSASVFEAFTRIQQDIEKACDEKIIIVSGYRSSAYQLIIVLENLKAEHWNLEEARRHVDLPGESEHNRPIFHAIDVIVDHMSSGGRERRDFSVLQHFGGSRSFQWLTDHAQTYGFSLSFPEGNTRGKIFEPWHWLFEGVSHPKTKIEPSESQIEAST